MLHRENRIALDSTQAEQKPRPTRRLWPRGYL